MMRWRVAAVAPIIFTLVFFPSPWNAVAVGIMLYLVYRHWDSAQWLGVYVAATMILFYFVAEYASYRLGYWPYTGERLFYTSATLAGTLAWLFYHTAIAVFAMSVYLAYFKLVLEAVGVEKPPGEELLRLSEAASAERPPAEAEKKEEAKEQVIGVPKELEL